MLNLTIASFCLLITAGVAAGQTVTGVESILGKWVAKAQTPTGPLEIELELKMEGNQLLGSMASMQGSTPLTGLKFQDPDLSLEIAMGAMTFKLTGVLKDGRFAGKWEQVGAEMQGTWTAERKAVPESMLASRGIAGAWDSVAVTAGGEIALSLDLQQDGEKVTGTLSSQTGKLQIQSGSFKDQRLQVDVDLNGKVYRISGTLKDDKISGQWSVLGADETGAWSATRKTVSAAVPAAPVLAGSLLLDGTWNAVAVTPNGNLAFPLVLKQTADTVSGNALTMDGAIAVQKGKFVNNVLTFELEYAGTTYRIEATLSNGQLTGKWAAVNGPETGAWTAERKTP